MLCGESWLDPVCCNIYLIWNQDEDRVLNHRRKADQPLTREVVAILSLCVPHSQPLLTIISLIPRTCYTSCCTLHSKFPTKYKGLFLKTYKKTDQMKSMIDKKFRGLLLLKLKCWIFFLFLGKWKNNANSEKAVNRASRGHNASHVHEYVMILLSKDLRLSPEATTLCTSSFSFF